MELTRRSLLKTLAGVATATLAGLGLRKPATQVYKTPWTKYGRPDLPKTYYSQTAPPDSLWLMKEDAIYEATGVTAPEDEIHNVAEMNREFQALLSGGDEEPTWCFIPGWGSYHKIDGKWRRA